MDGIQSMKPSQGVIDLCKAVFDSVQNNNRKPSLLGERLFLEVRNHQVVVDESGLYQHEFMPLSKIQSCGWYYRV